jgi:hypothetical protein
VFSRLFFEAYRRPMERRGAWAPRYDEIMVGVACEVEGARCRSRLIGGV